MTNTVVIIGRLTRDPEIRTTGNGVSVVNFTLAVERDQRSSSGEKMVDFIPVVAWDKTAEAIYRYLSKGSLCSVTGSIQTRTYEVSEDVNRLMVEVYTEKIHFLSGIKRG